MSGQKKIHLSKHTYVCTTDTISIKNVFNEQFQKLLTYLRKIQLICSRECTFGTLFYVSKQSRFNL